jgi:NO-binding membrane sensor protein with MHYT domain
MKKTYIIPSLYIAKVHYHAMIAVSLKVNYEESVEEQYVKDDISSNRNFNVWDEDWNQ